MSPRDVNKNDLAIARAIEEIRYESGLGLIAVAQGSSVSLQQISKYERGKSRITAARLYELAVLFNRPIEHFFKYMDKGEK